MVAIQGLRAATPAAAPKPRAAASGGFSVPADGAAADAAAPLPAPVLLGMLALQEAAEDAAAETVAAARDRLARRSGRALLDALAAAQRGLLACGPEPEALALLERLAAQPADAADPGLARILAEIRLRARVELARYTAADGT